MVIYTKHEIKLNKKISLTYKLNYDKNFLYIDTKKYIGRQFAPINVAGVSHKEKILITFTIEGPRLITKKYEFSPEEEKLVSTVFEFYLPFLLQKFKGEYKIPFECKSVLITVIPSQVQKETAESILKASLQSDGITALGDYWGRLNYSGLIVEFPFYTQLIPKQIMIDEKTHRDVPPSFELDEKNTQLICKIINKLIDAHAICTNSFFIRPLVPSDILSWCAYHKKKVNNKIEKVNKLEVPPQKGLCFVHPADYSWEIIKPSDVLNVFNGEGKIPFFKSIILNAKRALYQGNLRISIIDSCRGVRQIYG
ncbi:MAG: hypothetical protein HY934_05250 [Candidatus Firestonebacteria bacterium]|nr:hypothetical protein [Candidatus Firestonebacteria bacterium]